MGKWKRHKKSAGGNDYVLDLSQMQLAADVEGVWVFPTGRNRNGRWLYSYQVRINGQDYKPAYKTIPGIKSWASPYSAQMDAIRAAYDWGWKYHKSGYQNDIQALD